MLKPNDEGRGADALQETEGRPFGLARADEAAGGESSTGQVLARPVVEQPDSEWPHAAEERQTIAKANDPLPGELDALARRLGARTREFSNSGEFSNAHDAFLEHRHQRHAAIEAKLEAAIRRGAIWDSILLEFERDFDALFDNFGHLLDRMDAAAMKGR